MGPCVCKPKTTFYGDTSSILQAIESEIDFLQTPNEILSLSPQIELLILLLSRIHLVINEEFMDKFEDHNLLFPLDTVNAMKVFKSKLQKILNEIHALLQKSQTEPDEIKRNEILDRIAEKVEPLIIHFPQITTQKKLNIRFPKFENEENVFEKFDLALARLKKIYEEIKGKLEKGQKSIIAVYYWEKKFPNESEVQYPDFEEKLKDFSNWMYVVNLKVHFEGLEKIKKQYPEGKVGKREFDELVWKVLNVSYRRKELFGRKGQRNLEN